MSEAKLYLRRLADPGIGQHLTVGKLYAVTESPMEIGLVTDDIGRRFHATRAEYWQKVWVLPDGSEVPAL